MHQNVGFEERFGRGTHSRNGNDPNAGKMNATMLILVCLKIYIHIFNCQISPCFTLLVNRGAFTPNVLTDHEKSLLSKGVNSAIPLKDINYADYLLPFDLLDRDINSLKISNFYLDCIKARIQDSAFVSYKETYGK